MKIILLILLILMSYLNLKSQTCTAGNFELIVCNKTSNNLLLKLYPVSAIMNGHSQYNLVTKERANNATFNFDFINGTYYENGNLFYTHYLVPDNSYTLE